MVFGYEDRVLERFYGWNIMREGKQSNVDSYDENAQAEEILLLHRELCTQMARDATVARRGRFKNLKKWLLKLSGLHDRGRLNYLDIDSIRNLVMIDRLPDELSGLRVLQIGNLHLSSHDGLLEALYEVIESVEYDICILTGGMGLGLHNDVLMWKRAERLMKSLSGNVFAVLGIGDTVQSMEVMRGVGMTVLHNEFQIITLMGRKIEIFGLECSSALIDPRFERRIDTFNLSDLRIVVASNPQFRVMASRLEFDLMLTGLESCHLCVYKDICRWNLTARKFPSVSDDWVVDGLQGYSSRGLGKNELDVRFISRPEIVLHEFLPKAVE